MSSSDSLLQSYSKSFRTKQFSDLLLNGGHTHPTQLSLNISLVKQTILRFLRLQCQFISVGALHLATVGAYAVPLPQLVDVSTQIVS